MPIIALRPHGGFIISAHNALTGLLNNDHPQYAFSANFATHTAETSIHYTTGNINIKDIVSSHTHTDFAFSGNFATHTGDTSIHYVVGDINIKDVVSSHTHNLFELTTTAHTHEYSATTNTSHTHDLRYIQNTGHSHYAAIQIGLDGGGAELTVNKCFDVFAYQNMSVLGWQCIADQTGSVAVGVWKDTVANFPPTVADSVITASTASAAISGVTLETPIAINVGDVLRFNVNSVATIQRVTVALTGVTT